MKNDIINFNNFNIYLCGSIDDSDDRGVVWRDNVTDLLCDIGFLRHNIFNPCNKPHNSFNGKDLDAYEHVSELRDAGKWDEIERLSKNTIRIDLRLVDKSDLLYIHVNTDVHMCGSYDEVSIARTQKKPVIAVVHGGIAKAPYWLIGRIGRKHIFSTDSEAIAYINDVVRGNIAFDPKSWLFFGR